MSTTDGIDRIMLIETLHRRVSCTVKMDLGFINALTCTNPGSHVALQFRD